MTTDNTKGEKRKPVAFEINDPKVSINETKQDRFPELDELAWKEDQNALGVDELSKPKGVNWFSVFLTSIAGLVLMAFLLWLAGFVSSLFFRQDLIGWISLSLLGLALLSASILLLKEIFAISRMKKIGQIRRDAEEALETNTLSQARGVLKLLETIFSSRKDMQWNISGFRDNSRDVLDADQLLILAERDILVELDKQAQNIIASSSRRVALVTAISPAATLDMAIVLYENIRMLRRLSSLYGGRPGLLGLYRLGKMTLTHLTLTGGLALTGGAIQQLVGQKLAARLSARFGEGIFNGTMTARIGMAAMDVCRPLPFIKSSPGSIKDFMAALFRSESSGKTLDNKG